MAADHPLTLTEEQLEHLADLLAIKLAAVRRPPPPMLTVEDISAAFQVSRAWVYENAARLGGVKLGPGQRAPLRFDADRVVEALNPLTVGQVADTPARPTTHPRRPRVKRLHPVYDG